MYYRSEKNVTCLKIVRKGAITSVYNILSYAADEDGIVNPVDVPLQIQKNRKSVQLSFSGMGLGSYTITVVATTNYTVSGDLFTGVFVQPQSVTFSYTKDLYAVYYVSSIEADFATIGNLYEASGSLVSGGYGYCHSIISSAEWPAQYATYSNTNPLPNGRKIELTGWLGPAMTVTVTAIINNYEVSRILSAMPPSN